jgi:DNA primase
MISPESIQTLRDTVRLIDIMREDCDLKRSGSRWVCCCPFHAERTPSCFINEDQNSYHCFGCGASGDAIGYVMSAKGLAFAEALEFLAAKYGITLVHVSRDGSAVRGEDRRAKGELERALSEGQRFFRWCLERAPDEVRSYLSSRGITEEAIQAFGIGFAPVRGEGVLPWLRKANISDEVGITVGLLKRHESGQLIPAFRGRIIFPIISERNQVIGFGGRIVPSLFSDDRDRPKYLNSVETPLYRKHKTLYGLPLAMRAIRERGEVIIVEGYLDVIGLWQAGVRHVVACCGTALTPDHAERLARLVRRLVVIFDGDDAGRGAAARAFKTIADVPVDVWASFLSDGEDPFDVARRLNGGTADYLDSLPKRSLLSAFIDDHIRRAGGEESLGPVARSSLSEQVREVLSTVSRDVVRHELIREAASRLRIDPNLLNPGLPKPQIAQAAARAEEGEVESSQGESTDSSDLSGGLTGLEQQLLIAVMGRWETAPALVLSDPDVCAALSGKVVEFIETLHRIAKDDAGDSEKGARVKQELRRRGKEWIALWRKAFAMASDPGADLDKMYQDCAWSCRRQRLGEVAREVELEIARAESDEERAILFGRKLAIRRQLDQCALPRPGKSL